jgi:hypothetical protein
MRLIKSIPGFVLVSVLAACSPAALPPTPVPTPAPTEVRVESATNTPVPPTPAPTAEPTAVPPTAEPASTPTEAPKLISGVFVPQEVLPSGSFTLDPDSGILRFSDDFKVSTGPDLYVILSGASEVNLEYHAFSQQVLASPKLDLDKLRSVSGAQQYTLPAGTDLSQYHSVVVWCQTYSVAFVAAPLNP